MNTTLMTDLANLERMKHALLQLQEAYDALVKKYDTAAAAANEASYEGRA